MNNIKIDIPDNVNNLIRTLQSYGHSAYVVGGCVRDTILKRPIHDWDVCTSATPSEMLEVFKGKRIIETGLQHGTVTVVENGMPVEITTFRIDGIYSDNRRPDQVTFTNALSEDLKRRDFTINAMAYNDTEGLIDLLGGLEDIKRRRIRCVGSAVERFNEDALRILRAIRFASQLGFIEESETSFEIYRQCKNLKNISIERINGEFCKIASSDNFYAKLLLYSDVFSLFIPELKHMIDFPQNNPYHAYDVLTHTIHAVKHCESEDLITRLAVFFHDFGKPHSYQDDQDGVRHFKGHGKISADMADTIMKRLRFDNATRNDVVELVYYHDATFEADKKHIKRWLNKIGENQFRRLLEVRKADIKGQKPDYDKSRIENIKAVEILLDEILQEQECFSLKDLVINGNDVKQIMCLKEGKSIGFWLNDILERVINGELKNEREELISWMIAQSDSW